MSQQNALSSVWICLCLDDLSSLVNDFGHLSHMYDWLTLSVTFFTGVFFWPFILEHDSHLNWPPIILCRPISPHISHTTDVGTMWTFLWFKRMSFLEKLFGHSSHEKSGPDCSLWTTILCLFKCHFFHFWYIVLWDWNLHHKHSILQKPTLCSICIYFAPTESFTTSNLLLIFFSLLLSMTLMQSITSGSSLL